MGGFLRASDLRRPVRATLRDMREDARKGNTASRLALSGLSVAGENVTQVDGDLVVLGDFIAQGKVDNDALTNPVQPGQRFQGTSNFSLSVVGGYKISISVAVPAGFSQVIISAYGRIAAINSTGSPDYLYCSLDVDGIGGNQFGVPVLAGGFNTTSAGYSTLRTGLNEGDTLVLGLYGSTGSAGFAANVGNGADVSATYLWLR